MPISISEYIAQLPTNEKQICEMLRQLIDQELTESTSKIWHAHPVWFIADNPIVGFSLQKKGVRLMFWSGADFEEELLNVCGGKFKDASVFFNSVSELSKIDLERCLQKSKIIQWDYKNIVQRKGRLERL